MARRYRYEQTGSRERRPRRTAPETQKRPKTVSKTQKSDDSKAAAALAVIMSVLIIVAGFFVVTKVIHVVHRIDVVVDGDTSLTADQIVETAGIRMGEPVSDINEGDIARNLANTGTMSLADIQCSFWGNLTLTVAVREASGLVKYDNGYIVVDPDAYMICETQSVEGYADCLIFEDVDVNFSKTGRKLQSRFPGQIDAMISMMAAEAYAGSAPYITSVSLEDSSAITAVATRDVIVKLGSSDEMIDKLNWIKAVMSDLADRGESGGTLDVSGGDHADYRPQG